MEFRFQDVDKEKRLRHIQALIKDPENGKPLFDQLYGEGAADAILQNASNEWIGGAATFGQGAALGWADELAGLYGRGKALSEGQSWDEADQVADEYNQSYDQRLEAFKARRPNVALGTEVAGGFATGFTGGAKTAGAKGLSLLARTSAAAATGAGLGAASGAGYAEENNRLAGALVGGAIGGTLSPALTVAGVGAQSATNETRRNLANALSNRRFSRDLDRMFPTGGSSSQLSSPRITSSFDKKPVATKTKFDLPPLWMEMEKNNPNEAAQRLAAALSGGAGANVTQIEGALSGMGVDNIRRGADAVVKTFRDDAIDPRALSKVLKDGGPEGRVVDFAPPGQNVNALLRDAAAQPGPLRSAASRAAENAVEDQAAKIEREALVLLNGGRSFEEVGAHLAQKLKSEAKPVYDQLYADYPAGKIDASSLTKYHNSPAFQSALKSRNTARANNAEAPIQMGNMSFKDLDQMQRTMRRLIDDTKKSIRMGNATPEQTDNLKGLINQRTAIIKVMEDATGGEGGIYGTLRRKYAGEAADIGALDLGRDIFKGQFKKRPDLFAKEIQDMSESERQNLKIGVAQAFIDEMGARVTGEKTASGILNKGNTKKLLRNVFDSDEELDAFVRVYDEVTDQARRMVYIDPNTNSKTANVQTEGQHFLKQGVWNALKDKTIDIATNQPNNISKAQMDRQAAGIILMSDIQKIDPLFLDAIDLAIDKMEARTRYLATGAGGVAGAAAPGQISQQQ